MPGPVDTVLLGCAHLPHARSYARALDASSLGRLVGVYDESPELGRLVAHACGVPYYREPRALLEQRHPSAAVICSTTAAHRPLVELAASYGVHSLCEKPLATTTADAAAMAAACRDRGVQLHTAFVSRFYPVVQEVRAIIARGELGVVRGLIGGNRGRPPVPPQYPPWITDPDEAGGGALLDHCVHVLDAMRFVTGLEARAVLAETATLFCDLEVEDSALMSVMFAEEVVASIDPSWSVTSSHPWAYDFYLRVLGSEGSVSMVTGRESIGASGEYDGRSYAQVPFEPDIDRAMVEAFLRSVAEGRVLSPCATGEDGLRAVEVARAAYTSAGTGAFVPLPNGA